MALVDFVSLAGLAAGLAKMEAIGLPFACTFLGLGAAFEDEAVGKDEEAAFASEVDGEGLGSAGSAGVGEGNLGFLATGTGDDSGRRHQHCYQLISSFDSLCPLALLDEAPCSGSSSSSERMTRFFFSVFVLALSWSALRFSWICYKP